MSNMPLGHLLVPPHTESCAVGQLGRQQGRASIQDARGWRSISPAITEVALRSAVLEFLRQEPGGRLVEELAVARGDARIDIARVGERLDGFELKSDVDTLLRLPQQRAIYNRVFDQVTLVVGSRHVSASRSRIPRWWGLIAAAHEADTVTGHDADMFCATNGVRLTQLRAPRDNPRSSATTIVELLWHSEALALAETVTPARGIARKSRAELWRILLTHVPPGDLRQYVCETLKGRGAAWRADAESQRNDD